MVFEFVTDLHIRHHANSCLLHRLMSAEPSLHIPFLRICAPYTFQAVRRRLVVFADIEQAVPIVLPY